MFRVLCLSVMLYSMTLSICGCSSDSDIEIGKPTTIPKPAPLSLDEWIAMTDISEKYDIATLNRLRENDPSLKSEKAWKKFMDDVVGPQLVKDKPLKEPI